MVASASTDERASGYLTSLQQDVVVSSSMMYNSVSGLTHTRLTHFFSGISSPDYCSGTDEVHIPSAVPSYSALVVAVMSAVAAGAQG